MSAADPQERAGDHGFLCRVAHVMSLAWDFIDRRDIDKHVTAFLILSFMLVGTVKITFWGYKFSETWLEAAKAGKAISGVEIAAVLAAICGPWSLMFSAIVPAVVAFYFKART